MAFNVTIQFSGLFVFVNRMQGPPASHRLYVLMANTGNAGHVPCMAGSTAPAGIPPHPTHIPKAGVGAANGAFNSHVDLSTLLNPGATEVKVGLPLTSALGETVEEALLTGPHGPVMHRLSGRIVLPPPSGVQTGFTASAEWYSTATQTWKPVNHPVTGQVTLTYTANAPFTIPGIGQVDSNKADIFFSNVPNPEPPHASYPKHTCFLHAHMHTPLFSKNTAHFRTSAPTLEPKKGGALQAPFGIEPVVCTTGNACPPGYSPPCDN